MRFIVPRVFLIGTGHDQSRIKLHDQDGARIDWVNYPRPMVESGQSVWFLSLRNTPGV